MKLALIPPIDLLDYTCETNLQLMLPHLVSDQRYSYTYMKHCLDPKQYVILDNGAAEGEQNLSGYSLLMLAEEYGVDEVVVPDTIGDFRETKDKALMFFSDVVDYVGSDKKEMRPTLQFVVQGGTMDELKECALWAIDHPMVDVIALPRHILTLINGADGSRRSSLADWIYARSTKPIHLLGGSPYFPCEIRDNGHWPRTVRSHDTSSPFNFAYEGKKLRIGNVVKRPNHYFDLEEGAFDMKALDYNVSKLKEWTGCDK